MTRTRSLLRIAVAGAVLASLAACLDSGPTTAEGAAQQYVPSFGGAGGAASTELAGIRAPSAMTCRFVSSSGRVECDPTTTNGVTFRASFQFLDARGRPQSQRDGLTNSINERTEMLGVPTGFGTVTPGAILFDSVSSRSDVTRRGLLDSVYVINGEHTVRTRSRLVLSGADTGSIVADASTQWRDLRYPREAVLFRPAPPVFAPGATLLSADSITAVTRLTGAWARFGSRVDRTVSTTTSRAFGSATSSNTATMTYETADVARVEQVRVSGSTMRSSTCRVDRLSFSAVCQ
jgi:hypothetical protein